MPSRASRTWRGGSCVGTTVRRRRDRAGSTPPRPQPPHRKETPTPRPARATPPPHGRRSTARRPATVATGPNFAARSTASRSPTTKRMSLSGSESVREFASSRSNEDCQRREQAASLSAPCRLPPSRRVITSVSCRDKEHHLAHVGGFVARRCSSVTLWLRERDSRCQRGPLAAPEGQTLSLAEREGHMADPDPVATWQRRNYHDTTTLDIKDLWR
jgi:hypothetical protein